MNRVFLLFVTFSIALMASFVPAKTYTTVTAVNGDRITMQNSFAMNRMSGLVVRQLPSGEFALVTVKQTAPNQAVIVDKDPLGGKNLANLKPIPKIGDKVVGGFMYDKVMVLAPNRDTYISVQNKFGIRSVNPDIFMGFLANRGSSNPSSSDYKAFAKLTHIGLFVIFKNGFITLYDPLSDSEIGRVMMDISSYNAVKPFYNTFR